MKIVLVGLGYWGKILLPIIKKLESSLKFKLSAVCDRNRENLAIIETNFPMLEKHNDFSKMLKSVNPELVLICTGLNTHYQLIKESLNNGCHVFVEKPFVQRLDQAEELIKISKEKSLLLMVGHRLIYSPSVQWIKNNILCNKHYNNLLIEAYWKNWGIHQYIGVHWDLGTHYIAVINYLIGVIPKKVNTTILSISDEGVPENMIIILKYENDIQAKIEVSWNSPYKQKQLVIKTKDKLINIDHESDTPLRIFGAYAKDNSNQKRGYSTSFQELNKFSKTQFNEMNTIEDQFFDLLTAIRENKTTITNYKVDLNVIKILSMIEKDILNNHNN